MTGFSMYMYFEARNYKFTIRITGRLTERLTGRYKVSSDGDWIDGPGGDSSSIEEETAPPASAVDAPPAPAVLAKNIRKSRIKLFIPFYLCGAQYLQTYLAVLAHAEDEGNSSQKFSSSSVLTFRNLTVRNSFSVSYVTLGGTILQSPHRGAENYTVVSCFSLMASLKSSGVLISIGMVGSRPPPQGYFSVVGLHEDEFSIRAATVIYGALGDPFQRGLMYKTGKIS
ncbi:hypothetical protein ON010_g31 [Phytophthora cinnamomi]|nr:hypothetical protein ON010_g31 [Phytophthora cinnamomi]